MTLGRKCVPTVVILITLITLSYSARASGDDISSGMLLVRGQQSKPSLPLISTDVDLKVTGIIARAKVSQRFYNASDNWLEAQYVFPLPELAAVDAMRLKVGEQIIEGVIKEKEAAKKVYHEAKSAGKKTALLSQQRPNIFTTRVANIPPKSYVDVQFSYQHQVVYQDKRFELVFPMVVAPRYIPGRKISDRSAFNINAVGWAMPTDEVTDASEITSPVSIDESFTHKVTISADIQTGLDIKSIESLYHAIDSRLIQPGHYQLNLNPQGVLANNDFVLRWYPKPSASPSAALFHEKINNEHYWMALMMPPVDDEAKKHQLPRDVIFILDTSGSMAGDSILQAKMAIALAINQLKDSDRFNVIEFNSESRALFAESKLANPKNKQHAEYFIKYLDAEGGTEMMPALELAFKQKNDPNTVQQIIFLTDGSIGNEEALLALIDNKLSSSRLFTIGIGSAPNRYFLNKAAKVGRGVAVFIGSQQHVQKEMLSLFNMIEQPSIKNIAINWPGSHHEIYPEFVPDLYLGEPLMVVAKGGDSLGSVYIKGESAQSTWQRALNLQQAHQGTGIAKIWARQKIEALIEQLYQGESLDNIKQQVLPIALTHQLVSRFTSFVAVEKTPSRQQDELLQKSAVPSHLPAGWQHKAIFGSGYPSTATPMGLLFLVSALLWGLVVLFKRFIKV